MTPGELLELNAWIAEHVFGIEVEWTNGEPTRKNLECHLWGEGVGICFGTIPKYTETIGNPIKREIERRGWFWKSNFLAGPYPYYSFTIYGPDDNPSEFYHHHPLIGYGTSDDSEEIAACLALKEAVERTS